VKVEGVLADSVGRGRGGLGEMEGRGDLGRMEGRGGLGRMEDRAAGGERSTEKGVG